MKDNKDVLRRGAMALIVLAVLIGLYLISGGGQNDSSLTKMDLKKAFDVDSEAILNGTDVIFDDALTSDPKLTVEIGDIEIENRIESMRREMTQVLDSWEQLVNGEDADVVDSQTARSARQYADSVQNYVTVVRDLVHDLTPANSGLSTSTIETYRQVSDDAAAQADSAADILNDSQGDDDNNSNDDQSNPSSTEPQDGDDSQPPSVPPVPPPTGQSGEPGLPQLIEGMNPIN